MEDERHVFVPPAYLAQQPQSGVGHAEIAARTAGRQRRRHLSGRLTLGLFSLRRASHRETGVADDAEHVVGIALIHLHCFLITARQHHLRASALALCGGVGIECLGGEAVALLEYVAVEIGQYGGIEPDAVLDEQYDLDAGLAYVVVDVHLVLNELDDREDEIGVAEPAEDVVEDGEVLVLHAARDAVGERREHDAGYVRRESLDGACHVEGVVVGVARHTDDQVDVGGLQRLARLFRRAHLRERRRIAQAEVHILVEDFFVNPPVVLKHEGVVGIGNYQDVEDAARHEIDERHVFQIKVIPLLWYILGHTL